jgi:GNAT superfamily N-acetyltransferase
MFVEMGQADDEKMLAMVASFIPWVRERLKAGTYVGWFWEEDGRVVAGGGMWLMDFPPHWMDLEPVRAYLLNFYVEPAFRGRGVRSRTAGDCGGRRAADWDQSGFSARVDLWEAAV